jgi:hypothetical protein
LELERNADRGVEPRQLSPLTTSAQASAAMFSWRPTTPSHSPPPVLRRVEAAGNRWNFAFDAKARFLQLWQRQSAFRETLKQADQFLASLGYLGPPEVKVSETVDRNRLTCIKDWPGCRL